MAGMTTARIMRTTTRMMTTTSHGSELSEVQLRVRALETVLAEKGYVDPAALDAIVEAYETRIGPHIGAHVVAKAWMDQAFKQSLLEDANKAIAALGIPNRVGDHLVVIENTPATHNMVVCTLCSCYPWDVLGLPPVWYKSAAYRSRTVKEPRGVLADFGVTLPASTNIRVWDSTAETRFLVLPMRPEGTDGWGADKLAALVTRDSMIGTGFPRGPERLADEWRPRYGRHGRFRQSRTRGQRTDVPWCLGRPRARHEPGNGAAREWNIDVGRYWIEMLPAHVYLASSYYERWFLRLENLCVARGLVSRAEIATGHSSGAGRPVQGTTLAAADAGKVLARGSYGRPAIAPAQFKVGDRVRAKNIHPHSHTRLPRYVRGHVGVIERLHGCHVFPDAVVEAGTESPQWLYTVNFDNRELWGADADPTVQVSVDAFEPYLDAV